MVIKNLTLINIDNQTYEIKYVYSLDIEYDRIKEINKNRKCDKIIKHEHGKQWLLCNLIKDIKFEKLDN